MKKAKKSFFHQDLFSIDQVRTQNKTFTSIKWVHMIVLQTRQRPIFLFCPNEEEQFLWIHSFARLCHTPLTDLTYTIPQNISNMLRQEYSDT